MLKNDAIHHSGNSTNPTKNNHACNGLPPRSTQPLQLSWGSAGPEGSESVQGVDRTGPGFRGSLIWNTPEGVIEGACGEMSADMGIDACDMLRMLRLEGAR